jgi:hypothetical protein
MAAYGLRPSARLASYVAACVPPADRLLVLFFAPDIYFDSGRLMAQRHLVFVPAWAGLPSEQEHALARIRTFAPPIVLADASLDDRPSETYPAVVAYVREGYDVADTFEANGNQYTIFARRGRPVAGRYGSRGWPCYVPA